MKSRYNRLHQSDYAVVCHDAGAANIVMTQEQQLGFPAKYYLLSGPARTRWGKTLPVHKQVQVTLTEILHELEFVMTGTGWSSDAEHNARTLAKAAHTYSFALIDHWVNYKDRFTRNNTVILPDEILVCDADAKLLADEQFPSSTITCIPNRYFESVVAKIDNIPRQFSNQLLYVLEPVREDWGMPQNGPEEYQALDYFRRFIEQQQDLNYETIRLRLHPSEQAEKYKPWIQNNKDLPVIFDPFEDIEHAIANADAVFGCESYGLILALACGKRVYSTIPHWAPRARLPHRQLQHLRDHTGMADTGA